MSTVIVYIALGEEGTEVWRPVEATHLGGAIYRIIGAAPDDETWRFLPGSKVICVRQRLSDGSEELAVLAPAPDP